MSFLDNFEFAFQEIILHRKNYVKNKYWENIEENIEKITFEWVILKQKDFSENFLAKANNIAFTLKDWALRCNIDIEPKKWDLIESFWTFYEVIFTEKIIVEWEHDHNLAIIRVFD